VIKARRAAAAVAAAACVMSPTLIVAANPADVDAAGRWLRELNLGIEDAREEQRRLEAETAALAEELGDVRTRAAAAAAAVDAGSEDVATLERQLRHLTQREAVLAAALGARREQTAETLMALQRLVRLPPAAVLVHPDTPVDLLKAGALLGAAVEEIERRAQRLRQDLFDLDEARREIENRRRVLESAIARLREESAQLDRLIAKKAGLQAQLASRAWDVAERERQLARQAGDAESLVSRLRREEQVRQALASAIARHPPPSPSLRPDSIIRSEPQLRPEPERQVKKDPKPEPEANPGRPSRRSAGDPAATGYPARGRIVVNFGESREGSGASKGITWQTVSGATVVAPAAGTVAFAGPFRGYGLLLIVEHRDGYHSLLAGLERIDVEIGQNVRFGDSLGSMGHRSTGNLSLYMELRKDGHPVNPLPWLAAGKRKVSG
jgi:murein hydrolase activator